MKIVRDIIASKPKPVNFVDPDVLVLDALNILKSVNLSYLIVMKDGKFDGIFSERDYCRNVVLKGRSSASTYVKEIMSVDLPFVECSDTVEYCMNMMNTHNSRYLLAYERQQLQGIITIHDLLRQVIFNREEVFDHSLAEELLDQDERSRVF